MVVGWACLGGWVRERILMNMRLSFDECDNGSDCCLFQRDIGEEDANSLRRYN